MDLEMHPLINRLNSAIVTRGFLGLLIDNSETSSSGFPAVSPILPHFLIPTFRFRYVSRLSDMILKEFVFEFTPVNRSD